jgi:8-oxo-dGTP diphosphatase
MNKSPNATVGAIINRKKDDQVEILLTKRKIKPFRDHWCLPGGYVENNEPIETAIKREVQEETGLVFEPTYFKSFDDIFPEYNIHNVVNIFVGEGSGTIMPQASEVKEIKWFLLQEACALPLAFSHNEAIAAYQACLEEKMLKEELPLQYNTLRAEILKRMELRQQILTVTLAGISIFSAGVTGEIILPIFLLLYPLLGLCLAIAWSHHDVRTGELGEYILRYIEPHFTLKWEKYMREFYTDRNDIGKRLAEYASMGTFIGTEIAAIILAVSFQFLNLTTVTPPNSDLYLGFFFSLGVLDIFAVVLTYRFIHARRKRYVK